MLSLGAHVSNVCLNQIQLLSLLCPVISLLSLWIKPKSVWKSKTEINNVIKICLEKKIYKRKYIKMMTCFTLSYASPFQVFIQAGEGFMVAGSTTQCEGQSLESSDRQWTKHHRWYECVLCVLYHTHLAHTGKDYFGHNLFLIPSVWIKNVKY